MSADLAVIAACAIALTGLPLLAATSMRLALAGIAAYIGVCGWLVAQAQDDAAQQADLATWLGEVR